MATFVPEREIQTVTPTSSANPGTPIIFFCFKNCMEGHLLESRVVWRGRSDTRASDSLTAIVAWHNRTPPPNLSRVFSE